jgi:membrane protein involved in D-alanine export
MTPYLSFPYFETLLIVLVPAVLIGLVSKQRWMQAWIIISSIVMFVIQYPGLRPVAGVPVPLLVAVAGFLLYEFCVLRVFMFLRKYAAFPALTYAVVAYACVPMLVMAVAATEGIVWVLGFLGVYFISFRALDVIFGIGDETIGAVPSLQYFAYIAFFPTVSIGPVDRYLRFETDWNHTRTRSEVLHDTWRGIQRIMTGFLFKFIIAALMYQYWIQPTVDLNSPFHVIAFMYGITIYSFFDLAGYTEFAIGVSYFFGIHTPENFNMPFLAENIRDFWNRWHMSLTWWLRDYVYTRFVYAALKHRWFTYERTASYLGYIILMILVNNVISIQKTPDYGTFVVGLYMGLILIAYDIFHRYNLEKKVLPDTRLIRIASIALVFTFVSFASLLGYFLS